MNVFRRVRSSDDPLHIYQSPTSRVDKRSASTIFERSIIALMLTLSSAVAQENSHDSADAAILALACSGCHADFYQADTDTPTRLAGMDKLSFMRSMSDFKSGKRVSSIMNRIARGYDDAELQKMAEYFSQKKAMSP